MRKLLSTVMVAIAMVALINPLSAQCDWDPDPETTTFGYCLANFIPGGGVEYYCDTSVGEIPDADCTKSSFWY